MEIILCNDIVDDADLFKIDLIVWKSAEKSASSVISLQFKIDLIVWK